MCTIKEVKVSTWHESVLILRNWMNDNTDPYRELRSYNRIWVGECQWVYLETPRECIWKVVYVLVLIHHESDQRLKHNSTVLEG